MVKKILISLSLSLLLLINKIDAQDANSLMIKYWHNSLSRNIGVPLAQFKLSQGSVSVMNSSEWMWNIFDAISLASTSYYYNPDQHNSFSFYYGSKLYQMKIDSNTNKDCDVNQAILKYIDANYQYAWNKTIDQLFTMLEKSKGLTFRADTVINQQSIGLFQNEVIKNLLKLSEVKVSIHCSFDKVAIFEALPYSTLDTVNLILDQYKPWFSYCLYNKLFNNEPVLKAKNLQKQYNEWTQTICTALIVADGINIQLKLESSSKTLLDNIARYLPVDPDQIIRTIINHKAVYTLSSNTTGMAGNPILLGVLVVPINKIKPN